MELLEQMHADGMIRRTVRVVRREVVYVKSIVEAYPGLASILAPRREGSPESRLVLVFDRGAEREVDAMLSELAAETGLAVEPGALGEPGAAVEPGGGVETTSQSAPQRGPEVEASW